MNLVSGWSSCHSRNDDLVEGCASKNQSRSGPEIPVNPSVSGNGYQRVPVSRSYKTKVRL